MTVRVKVVDDGPIRLESETEGDFVLLDGKGNEYKLNGRKAISICRCGATSNKPFCDGAHKGCGFSSSVEAVELPPKKA